MKIEVRPRGFFSPVPIYESPGKTTFFLKKFAQSLTLRFDIGILATQ